VLRFKFGAGRQFIATKSAFSPIFKSLAASITDDTTMDEQIKKLRQLRLSIILTSIVGLLSFFSMTATTFSWGVGDTTLLYLLLYPTLLLSTILIIAKVRLGYILTLLTALSYSILLTSEVGKYLIFNFHNYVLFWVLLLPYLTFLALIPLTAIFLTADNKFAKTIKLTTTLLAIGIFIYSIADRFNKDYSDSIFVDAEINAQGQITLNCKPGFADSRTFIVTTNLKEIEEQIKKYGELYQGSYFLHNTKIKKNFRFSKLQSITLTKIGDNIISPKLTWTTREIKDDVDFLHP
jgi:hypothetical protein